TLSQLDPSISVAFSRVLPMVAFMILGILISWITIAFGLWVADKILDGLEVKGGVVSYLIVAAIFGTLSFLLGWLIYAILGIVTLGLGFLLSFITRVIVAAILLKVADVMSDRLRITSFKIAIIAAVIMALINTVADLLIRST